MDRGQQVSLSCREGMNKPRLVNVLSMRNQQAIACALLTFAALLRVSVANAL